MQGIRTNILFQLPQISLKSSSDSTSRWRKHSEGDGHWSAALTVRLTPVTVLHSFSAPWFSCFTESTIFGSQIVQQFVLKHWFYCGDRICFSLFSFLIFCISVYFISNNLLRWGNDTCKGAVIKLQWYINRFRNNKITHRKISYVLLYYQYACMHIIFNFVIIHDHRIRCNKER